MSLSINYFCPLLRQVAYPSYLVAASIEVSLFDEHALNHHVLLLSDLVSVPIVVLYLELG